MTYVNVLGLRLMLTTYFIEFPLKITPFLANKIMLYLYRNVVAWNDSKQQEFETYINWWLENNSDTISYECPACVASN